MVLLASLLASAAVAAAPTTQPPPPALRPSHVLAAAINVADLDGERDWYVATLGMQVVGQFPAKGAPFEWFLAFDKTEGHAAIALTRSKTRPAGPNAFGRTILQTPDAKGLAAWLKTQGVAVREAIPGVAYFVQDPEQNQIELYTPPK